MYSGAAATQRDASIEETSRGSRPHSPNMGASFSNIDGCCCGDPKELGSSQSFTLSYTFFRSRRSCGFSAKASTSNKRAAKSPKAKAKSTGATHSASASQSTSSS